MSAATHGKGVAYAERAGSVCCDVLDAWFDPSPAAILAFEASGHVLRTSPDAAGEPLIEAIAQARGLDPAWVTLGAGSSEIMHRVLPSMLGNGQVVLLDPTYSEYPYLVSRYGRSVRSVTLSEAQGFNACLRQLKEACRYASAAILVNPNNPTGQRLTRAEILDLKDSMAERALLWVDEAYVDYCPSGTSVEQDAGRIPELVVLKSLSKAYALSGIRAAYLVAEPETSARLKRETPPWIVGTAAQAAAVAALSDPAYYRDRWAESRVLLQEYAEAIRGKGYRVHTGWINAVLVRCPPGKTAPDWACELARKGLVVRTPYGMGESLGGRYIRIGLIERCRWDRVLAALS